MEFAHTATQHKGTANRASRNTLAYLAADEARLDELDAAVRDYLGWSHVVGNGVDLDLTENQRSPSGVRFRRDLCRKCD
jgi:hypothetical protein